MKMMRMIDRLGYMVVIDVGYLVCILHDLSRVRDRVDRHLRYLTIVVVQCLLLLDHFSELFLFLQARKMDYLVFLAFVRNDRRRPTFFRVGHLSSYRRR